MPSGYVIEYSILGDRRHMWQEITRVPSTSRNLPVSKYLFRHLDADKTYRFRVIPYRDDVYGRPVESLMPYRVPSSEESQHELRQRNRPIPPPSGPLTIEDQSNSQFRLSWRPPKIDHEAPLPGNFIYAIEQRVPGRRQWLEIARTPRLSHTVDVDTTSQFRVRTLLADSPCSLFHHGGQYIIGSDDGPQSEWIRFDERLVDATRRYDLTSTPAFDLKPLTEFTLPERLYTRHIGPSSVLLEWDYKKLPDRPSDNYLYLEQRLVPDSRKEFFQPLWEPVARIPVSSSKTSYEVTSLLPGHTYTFRLVDKFGSTAVPREISLPEPIRTRGGDLGRASLPKTTEYLMMPRSFNASFSTLPKGGLRFSWLPPESLEGHTDRVCYRIEARPVSDTSAGWRKLVENLTTTEYILSSGELEGQLYLRGLKGRFSSEASSDWHFRIIATADGVDSTPKLLMSPVSIAGEKGKHVWFASIPHKYPNKKLNCKLLFLPERKSLRFLNVENHRDIKCVPGQTLVIVVEIEGSPKPTVSW